MNCYTVNNTAKNWPCDQHLQRPACSEVDTCNNQCYHEMKHQPRRSSSFATLESCVSQSSAGNTLPEPLNREALEKHKCCCSGYIQCARQQTSRRNSSQRCHLILSLAIL